MIPARGPHPAATGGEGGKCEMGRRTRGTDWASARILAGARRFEAVRRRLLQTIPDIFDGDVYNAAIARQILHDERPSCDVEIMPEFAERYALVETVKVDETWALYLIGLAEQGHIKPILIDTCNYAAGAIAADQCLARVYAEIRETFQRLGVIQ